LASPEIVRSYVDDLHNLLNRSSLAEGRTFIKSFVREVRVTGSEVLLTYNIPLSAGSSSQETLVVPPIVHYGGPFGTVPELFFQKKELIPALQQLLLSYIKAAT